MKTSLTFSKKLKQLKYVLRTLSKAPGSEITTLTFQKLKDRLKKLCKQISFQHVSYKLRQATAALALAVGIVSGAEAQTTFAPAQINPFSLTSADGRASGDLVDIDNDGDLDLFFGENAYVGAYSYASYVSFSENTGTATAPVFAAPVQNPFGLPTSFSSYYAAPHFADMDNDGDLDLFVSFGDYYNPGTAFQYFENTGTASAPAFAAAVSNPFGTIVPNFVFPMADVVDIDNDGDLDMFESGLPIYNGQAVLFFQENTGNAGVPAFDTVQSNPFSFTMDAGTRYLCTDFADIDNDGDLDLFTTSSVTDTSYAGYSKQMRFYQNKGSASLAVFDTAVVEPFGISTFTEAADLIFGDMDNDGDLDLFIFSYQGDVYYYENTSAIPSSIEKPFEKELPLVIYPNPFDKELVIQSEAFENKELTMFNNLGQLMLSQQLSNASTTISTEELLPGIYLIRLKDSKTGQMTVRKVVKK